MFLDEAVIDVSGGKGGDGCISWRREKYIPKGGPDGGDGGRGANVYLIADNNTDTLTNFASKKVYRAPAGDAGRGQRKTGASGEHLYLKVPPGTIARNEDQSIIGELLSVGDQLCLVQGGRGGFGNAHFKSSVRQKPDFAEKGEPPESKKVHLELQLVADVGIIGIPSAGKSTLISVLSSAKPKIGDYPFTTIVPNLGVFERGDTTMVLCDVPGLIEGAADGKGLGHQFLRHIERCGIVLHLLDAYRGKDDPSVLIEDYQTIRSELSRYSTTLANKLEIVALSKIDLVDNVEHLITALQQASIDIRASFSSATRENVDTLSSLLLESVAQYQPESALEEETIPVLTPGSNDHRMGAFRIESTDSAIYIYGSRLEQFTKMTDFMSEGSVRRFRNVCDRIGLKSGISSLCKDTNKDIFIGDINVTPYMKFADNLSSQEQE